MTVLRSIRSCSHALAAFTVIVAAPALACGDGEAPTSCGDTGPEAGAKWMLKHVVSAVEADKPLALTRFTKGEGGFRTADTYVFCVGTDGVMNAHPNPILQGHNVRDLHDSTGNYFIAKMMDTAKPGEVSVIRYLFPKPGSTVATQKTTYYTRAGDQTCGVGVYDADVDAPTATPAARVAQLRQRLDTAMPAEMRGDWTAFLEALNAASGAQDASMAKARASLQAAQAALAPVPATTPDD